MTWGSGATGVSGTISASNSLIGSSAGDAVGGGGVTVLPNGNYLVDSYSWANGKATNAGAVTFGNGATGVHGVVSVSNSLVGSSTNDKVGGIAVNNWWPYQSLSTLATPATSQVVTQNVIFNWFGSGIQVLKNGNFVVSSGEWNQEAGAVTFGNGVTGVTGVVRASNSLIGGAAHDQIGSFGVTVLANGNYVVDSPFWANGAATGAGAVTWGSGFTGIHGVVGASNSLVGSITGDYVGYNGITELQTGTYVVDSSYWGNGSVGAVTFGNGWLGVKCLVSSANSLVGSTKDDRVGGLVPGPFVFNPAVTENAHSTSSVAGRLIYPLRSGIELMSDGDYLVVSGNWNNGAATNAGAVTWGSGIVGVHGVVSSANSLVGTTKGDEVGSGGIIAVGNSNYVVISDNWSNGSISDAGAVTFVRGDGGFKGAVSSRNSLVGSSAGDFVGAGGVEVLTNGNYLVRSPSWGVGTFETGYLFPWTTLGLGAVT